MNYGCFFNDNNSDQVVCGIRFIGLEGIAGSLSLYDSYLLGHLGLDRIFGEAVHTS